MLGGVSTFSFLEILVKIMGTSAEAFKAFVQDQWFHYILLFTDRSFLFSIRDIYFFPSLSLRCFYSKASPAIPTAPSAQEAAFTCDAAPGVEEGDAAAPLPDAFGLVLLDVPLGLPDMFSWEMAMPVLFLQWLL